jgi:hypothetical protein
LVFIFFKTLEKEGEKSRREKKKKKGQRSESNFTPVRCKKAPVPLPK